jgi:YD repeat-containing protein
MAAVQALRFDRLIARLVRVTLWVIPVVVLSMPFARSAQGQKIHPDLCGSPPCYYPIPSVTLTAVAPAPDTLSTSGDTVSIYMCADPFGSDTGKLDGTVVAVNLVAEGGCQYGSADLTLSVGTHTFTLIACSAGGTGYIVQCAPTSIGLTRLADQVTSASPTQNTPAAITDSTVFLVHNYSSTTNQYTITQSCAGSGVSGCTVLDTLTVSPGTPKAVSVHYTTGSAGTTGTVTLSAAYGGNTGVYGVTVNPQADYYLHVSTAYTNQRDQDASRCAYSCFTAGAALATIPYISRDAARSVGLVYNGDRVAVRPFIYADLSVGSGATSITDIQMTAEIYVSGAWTSIEFVNGDHNLNFSPTLVNGTGDTIRIGGQFNATSYTGNVSYPLQITVKAWFTDHVETVTDSSHRLLVVNNINSPYGRGWQIAGVNQLDLQSDGTNTYLMNVRGDGTTILFGPSTSNGTYTTWPGPNGSNATLLNITASPSNTMLIYPDSSEEVYNSSGYQIALIGRLRDTITIAYDSLNRVKSISDPFRLYSGAHTYTALAYGAHGLSSITEPAPNGQPGAGRVTSVTVDANGLLRTWIDPGKDTTTFGYDSQYRLDSLADALHNMSTYRYDSLSWKLVGITTPQVPIDSAGTGSTTMKALTTTYTPWQLAGVPTTTTGSTPATPVLIDSVKGIVTDPSLRSVHFTVDQWGQPLQITDRAGLVTKVQEDSLGNVRQVTHPTGAVDYYGYSGYQLAASLPAGQTYSTSYTYGAYAQLASVSGENQPTRTYYLGTRGHVDSMAVTGGATSHFFLNSSLMRDTLIVSIGSDTIRYGYDATTGNQNSISAVPSGRSVSKIFDGHGRDSTLRVTGASGTFTTKAVYDSLNRVVQSYDGIHSTPTSFTYNALYQTVRTDPLSQAYSATYNALGWVVSQTDPASRTQYATYNVMGSPTTTKNVRNQTVVYVYDTLGRNIKIRQPSVISGQLDTLQTFA